MTGPERDPAVLAALPEVQALIAAAHEVGADNLQSLANQLWPDGNRTELADRIRNLTPADATAALARIERDAEVRGMVKGMREAAEICHKHSCSNNPYVSKRMADAAAEILARAAKIEADALIEVYYQREMASEEPQGPHDLSIGGEQ